MTDVTPILSSAGSSSASSSSGQSAGGMQKTNKVNPFDDMLNAVQTVSVPDAKKIITDKKSTVSNLTAAKSFSNVDKTAAEISPAKKAAVITVANPTVASAAPSVSSQKPKALPQPAPEKQEDNEETLRDAVGEAKQSNNISQIALLSDDATNSSLPSVKKLSQNSADLLASVGVHIDEENVDSPTTWLPAQDEKQPLQLSETNSQKKIADKMASLAAGLDKFSGLNVARPQSDAMNISDDFPDKNKSDNDDQSQALSDDVGANSSIGLAATLAASPILASVVQTAIAQQKNVDSGKVVSSQIPQNRDAISLVSASKDPNYPTTVSLADLAMVSPSVFGKDVTSNKNDLGEVRAKFSSEIAAAQLSPSGNVVSPVADKPTLVLKANDDPSILTSLTSALTAKAKENDGVVSQPVGTKNQPFATADTTAVNDQVDAVTRDVQEISDMPAELKSRPSDHAQQGEVVAIPNNPTLASATVSATPSPIMASNTMPNIRDDAANIAKNAGNNKMSSRDKGTGTFSFGRVGEVAQNNTPNIQADMSVISNLKNQPIDANGQSVSYNTQVNAYNPADQNQFLNISKSGNISRSSPIAQTDEMQLRPKKDVEIESLHSEDSGIGNENDNFSNAMTLATNIISSNNTINQDSNTIALGGVTPNHDQVNVNNQLDLAHQSLWLDQLTHDIATASGSNSNLTFNLHPDHLGMLHVSIQSAGDGVAVHMTASSEAAQSIIAGARHDLLNEAHAQGVNITDARIDLNSQTMSQQSGQNGQPSHQQMADQQRSTATAPIINNTRNEQPDDDLAEEQKNRARYA